MPPLISDAALIGCWYEQAVCPAVPHLLGVLQSSSPTQMRQAGLLAISAEALTVTPLGVMVWSQLAVKTSVIVSVTPAVVALTLPDGFSNSQKRSGAVPPSSPCDGSQVASARRVRRDLRRNGDDRPLRGRIDRAAARRQPGARAGLARRAGDAGGARLAALTGGHGVHALPVGAAAAGAVGRAALDSAAAGPGIPTRALAAARSRAAQAGCPPCSRRAAGRDRAARPWRAARR